MPRLLLLFTCWLLLAGCALEYDVPAASAGPLDSTFRAATGLSARKVKFKGPVTFQLGGAGNTATALVKPAAPVASAPSAAAEATSHWGISPWLLAAGGLVLLLLLVGLVYRFRRHLLTFFA